MMTGRSLRRRMLGGLLLGLCACALWLAPVASAAGSGGSNSGVYDQYTEQIPTAGGPHNTGSSGGGPTGGSGNSGGGGIVLPANLSSDAGKDAKKLRDVATSPRYGAPNRTIPLPDSSAKAPAALSSAVNAVTDGSDSRMVGLFIALLAVTAVSLGAAAARRRA